MYCIWLFHVKFEFLKRPRYLNDFNYLNTRIGNGILIRRYIIRKSKRYMLALPMLISICQVRHPSGILIDKSEA